jgi:hypothetical protein
MRDVCRVLAGKPERKRPVGQPRYTQRDNIKIEIKKKYYGTGLD